MGSNSTNSTRAKCTDLQMSFQYSLYAATYILRFILSLWANSIALWFCVTSSARIIKPLFSWSTSLWLIVLMCCPYPSGFTIKSATIGLSRGPFAFCTFTWSISISMPAFVSWHVTAFRDTSFSSSPSGPEVGIGMIWASVLPSEWWWGLPVCYFKFWEMLD